jgi:hypothetical protein
MRRSRFSKRQRTRRRTIPSLEDTALLPSMAREADDASKQRNAVGRATTVRFWLIRRQARERRHVRGARQWNRHHLLAICSLCFHDRR